MSQPQPDDLFDASRMSFGDHLDELRSALIKSILAVTVGFLIGLLGGRQFVHFVTAPLKEAVAQHKLADGKERYLQELIERRAQGEPLPADNDELKKYAEIFVKLRLSPRRVFVDPQEFVGAAPAPKAEDLRAITIFESVDDNPEQIITTDVTQGFMVYVKASLVLGIILSSPFVFYFFWNFVAAGLYPHERKYVYTYLPFSLGLFLAGAALAFFFVIKIVLEFLLGFNRWLEIEPYPVINQWLGFILMMPIGMGISFQMPLVMLFMERFGILNIESYLTHWRISVVVIFFMSMILTPADPYSIWFMAIPLTILYFLGILLCKYMPKRPSPWDAVAET